jgi:EKC/KEOPS complex subunit CGI121/TPRKB
MSLETLHLEHLPAGYAAHIALFHDVTNAEFLQQQLLAGNTDFEYAFLDASIVSLPVLPFWHVILLSWSL